MPRLPKAGEVWRKSAYKRLTGDIGRVDVTEVHGDGLQAQVSFIYRFGSKKGHRGRLSASGFIKVYEWES